MNIEVGDLVVRKDDEENVVFKVTDVTQEEGDEQVYVIVVDADNTPFEYFLNELNLVCKEQFILKHDQATALVPVTAERTVEDIHNDICNMFAQVFNMLEPKSDGKRMQLRIEADAYNSKDGEVKFIVDLGYGDVKIASGNLFHSARIALSRFTEDKSLQPRKIARYQTQEDKDEIGF